MFHQDLLLQLQNIFLGLIKPDENGSRNDDHDVDGVPMDAHVGGEDDVDGIPFDSGNELPNRQQQEASMSMFKTSKWETITPS